ncbi:UDP-N-acetylmuramoyl-tripeptide--D-alanyl-D-alanine ligase [Jonesia denitrificans]|nr:UDP-N-acetylmuramoyl-tripeptide--D-alanyl-D-alanine ligase [Jonesia denitrificans]QXB42282.1 UDP-N-acetylmuramoyl-tripeptide--D-alanyl-D-alanine ligase [Jonesia denitrificans]
MAVRTYSNVFTAQEIASITGGELSCPSDVTVTGQVTIDSRTVSTGDLFVAVVGERSDGHDYACVAHSQGAVLVLSQKNIKGVPCVVVADTQRALGDLARAHLARLREKGHIRVIGVTGSAGKTTTKDLMGQMLATYGNVVVPAGSLNNELGLPLTVLKADETTDFLVTEMGASAVGDLHYLTSIAPLDIAVVLIVGLAHLGGFGSAELVAQAKSELVTGLLPQGIAVLNADDHRVIAMKELAHGQVRTFGSVRGADMRAINARTDAAGRAHFDVETTAGDTASVTLTLVGEHHVTNALAALTAVTALGMPLDQAAVALSAARATSPHRMDVVDRPDGVTIIDDSYNANPDSMRAALRALATVAGRQRRTVAVLGEMRELGPQSRTYHDDIGRLVVRLNISRLIVVGQGAQGIADGALQEGSWGDEVVEVADLNAAHAALNDYLQPNDVVLIKASHGSGLWQLADELTGKAANS